nr:MAG TPA: hypothetical protein [Caudoviricetes sp.]
MFTVQVKFQEPRLGGVFSHLDLCILTLANTL